MVSVRDKAGNGNGYKNGIKVKDMMMSSGTVSSIDGTAHSFVLRTIKTDYTVTTDAATKFMPVLNGGTFEELVVGHKVFASGILNDTILAAKKVTDLTLIQTNNQAKMTFSGTVTSGDSSASGWLVTTKKSGNITVMPDGNTKYYVITKDHKGKTAGTAADVTTGSKIQARGAWDSASKTLTKALVITIIK